MELLVKKIDESSKKPKPEDEANLGFGKYFSDHFFHMKYEPETGWHDATIEPYKSLELDPAALVFHYGQEIFEGLKAYKGNNGDIYLFRPESNFERFNISARRLCMPEIDMDFVIDAMKQLITLDRDWIPESPGTSLYIRPTMIATEGTLGVKVSSKYLFFIITGPAGAYYPEGFNPIKIFVSDKYVRAIKGGVGNVKTGGNYAASLLAAQEAIEKGYSQVLWLDAVERKYVEEVGTSNIFFLINDTLVTPDLSGSILPGITRDSVLQIARDWGIKTEERRISIDEVIQSIQNGELKEIFGSGTAAIVSPVKEFNYKGETYNIGNGKTGDLSERLYNEILQIQYGQKPDPFGWVDKI